LKYIYNNFARM